MIVIGRDESGQFLQVVLLEYGFVDAGDEAHAPFVVNHHAELIGQVEDLLRNRHVRGADHIVAQSPVTGNAFGRADGVSVRRRITAEMDRMGAFKEKEGLLPVQIEFRAAYFKVAETEPGRVGGENPVAVPEKQGGEIEIRLLNRPQLRPGLVESELQPVQPGPEQDGIVFAAAGSAPFLARTTLTPGVTSSGSFPENTTSA